MIRNENFLQRRLDIGPERNKRHSKNFDISYDDDDEDDDNDDAADDNGCGGDDDDDDDNGSKNVFQIRIIH